METDSEIYFYSHTKGNHIYMSNFYPSDFIDKDGIAYNCSEQYFIYHKAKLFEPNSIQLHNKILNEKNPSKIKALGRSVKNFDNEIWNQSKYQIMLNGLRLKFGQNKSIANKLIQTNNKMLFEASPHDKIWGIGFSAKNVIKIDKTLFGTNLLGKALVQIRSEYISSFQH